MSQRDGVLTTANGRLRFSPETYPVAHLANEGWRKEPDGTWTAPATPFMVQRLHYYFPNTDGAILAWSRLQAGPGPLVVPMRQRPPRWHDLYPYQQRAAEWLAQRKSALLSLSPGLGKSAVALTAAQMAFPHQPRVLVVCPLTLLSTWQQQTRLWWPKTPTVTTDSPSLFADTDCAPLVATMTYDALWRATMIREQRVVNGETRIFYQPNKIALRSWTNTFDLAILDESVLIKNRDAIRARAAAQLRQVVSHCWELSGSPTTRFLDDLWMQLHVLEPQQHRSYWRFTNGVCLTRDTIWGRQVVANVPGAEATLKQTLAPILYTYNYTDLARDDPSRAIPEWVFETRQVPLPPKWWALYQQMQTRFLADLPDGNRILASNVLARMVRLLQLASHPALLTTEPTVLDHEQAKGERMMLTYGGRSPVADEGQDFPEYDWSARGGKLSAIAGLLEELPGPCIVWTNFIATAKHLASTLKAPLLIGETPAEERTQIVQDFQAGKHQVLIAHPGVGRFGLTLTRARSAIYAERSYDGDAWVQSLSRIRRIGTTEPPHVVILEATGPQGERSIDHIISLTLRYRKERSDVLTTSLVREALG